MAMLEVNNLHVKYGVIEAIKGIDFTVNKGEVIALIGANGAGKTTILHTVSGLITPSEGTITFEGKDITKTPGHKIVSMGMAHVPEGRRVFQSLSVLDNLRMGAYTRKDKREIADIKLSRYACFMIVMNGDPRKEVIALGQTYFAVGKKVRQTIAELGGTMPENLPTPKISAKKLKNSRIKGVTKQ